MRQVKMDIKTFHESNFQRAFYKNDRIITIQVNDLYFTKTASNIYALGASDKVLVDVDSVCTCPSRYIG